MRRTLIALPILLASAASAQIVINEIDYDQISTDNAEYIEIKNIGETAFPMQYVAVVMYNGSSGTADEYRTISSPSWPPLEPGAYFVICGNSSLTQNCDHAATPITNLIQNGPTDAIALVWTENSDILDVVGYGGSLPGYFEGTGTTAIDSNDQDGLSLCRWPDGSDTDNNDMDFVVGCPTPGEANILDPVNCALTTGLVDNGRPSTLLARPSADGSGIVLSVAGGAGDVRFDVFATDGSLIQTRSSASTANNAWTLSLPDRSGQVLLVRAHGEGFSVAQKVVMP